MPAPYGNNNNARLKTKEIKEKVYKDYCEHIAKGLSHRSWSYDKDGIMLTWESMERYIREDVDLDPSYKQKAISASMVVWEKRGLDMMLGKIEKCQPAIYQMFMRNKFGWDKKAPEVIEENTSDNADVSYSNEG